MSRAGFAVALLAAGCGRVGFDARTDAGAAATLAQRAYLKASNTGAGDQFGFRIALSGDGTTMAVGAHFEDSAAVGVDGDASNNASMDAGAVYVFVRSGSTWVQQAYLKASNTGAGDELGFDVALSTDGSVLVASAYHEDSNATGIDGVQTDNSAADAGAVYVFGRSGTTWTQRAYIKASNTESPDIFGFSVALSRDGSTLAVGASLEDSNATGIDGNEADNSAVDSGAVYVFMANGATWLQQAYVKASNTGAGDRFGASVALSDTGSTLVVGASQEDSAATGIGGNQADNSATDAGAVYVFSRAGAAWSQQAYVKPSNTGAGDRFGNRVVVSGDGTSFVAGAYFEDGSARSVDAPSDESATDAGAAYVFAGSGANWMQQAYLKPSNTDPGDLFGVTVALSGDGNTIAVGSNDDSAAAGVDGDQLDNSSANAGAVYLFRRGATWAQTHYVKASNPDINDQFGDASLALSADGAMLAVGAFLEASAATGVDGAQADNSAAMAGAVYVFE